MLGPQERGAEKRSGKRQASRRVQRKTSKKVAANRKTTLLAKSVGYLTGACEKGRVPVEPWGEQD
jgi:hypothetical protein